MDVIWYLPAQAKPVQADLARLFRGPVPSAVFRTSWNDPDALFVAFKAGYNRVNHGHLDLGQFVLDALGVRWVRDLGSDNYNLPNYWGSNQNATRWTYYRLGSSSHNIVTLDGDNQNVDAVTKITDFRADGKDGFAVADLTSAYTPKASKALRGVRLVDGRAVLVQDELQIAKACEVVWGVTTDATVSADGASATLKLDGKTLTARHPRTGRRELRGRVRRAKAAPGDKRGRQPAGDPHAGQARCGSPGRAAGPAGQGRRRNAQSRDRPAGPVGRPGSC